ncbi:MAG: hypothetical protein ACOYBE_07820 [Blautia sp.]|jgi:type II secretory pathway pseudopilin PulG
MLPTKQIRKKENRKGFTLVELVVTGVILLLLLGIGGGSIVKYQQYSNFKKNNDYARTIFSAAQSALSYYKTGGSLDELTKASDLQEVTLGDDSILFVEMTKNEYKDVIEANKNTPAAEDLLNNSFYQLLKDYVADKTVFNAAIRIEFQKDNGNVTAVYYCDRVNQLVSGNLQKNEADNTMGIGDPAAADWDTARKALYLGYYGAESVKGANITPKTKPANISNIDVDGQNILEASWHLIERNSSPQVKIDTPKKYNYRVQFYDQTGTDLKDEFYFLGQDMSQTVPVKCYSADGSLKDYKSRIYVKDGEIHLVLDAIDLSDSQDTYNIGRISNLNVSEPIIIKVAVFIGEFSEIEKDKDEKKSSVFQPTMEDASGSVYSISCARHLYNIRFIENKDASNTYVLTKEIDWKDTVEKGEVFNETGNSAFLSIPVINKGSVFNGNSRKLKNFIFRSDLSDSVGLFGNNQGTIKNVGIEDVKIVDSGSTYTYAGMLCGKNLGTIEDVNVQLSSKNQGQEPVEINADYAGGLAGMTCGDIIDGYFWGNIKNLQAFGGVTGGLAGIVDENADEGMAISGCMSRGNLYSDGEDNIRGGIVGLWRGKDGKVFDCRNRMNIQAGFNTGGIVGAHNADNSSNSTKLLIDKCRNYGKPTEIDETEPAAYEAVFGGILGSRVEHLNTKTSITNSYGVSDVMNPITRYTLQTEDKIGPENLVQDEKNYYFIEPSSDVELARIDAPRASWEWLSNYYVKGKMVDQSSDTRYEVSILVADRSMSITFYFERMCDISDITIDWYGSQYMKEIEYSIHKGAEATDNNNVLGKTIKCNSFVNSHREIQTDLRVDNENPLKTDVLTIQIEGYDSINWWNVVRPGIWEVRFNSESGNVQNNRNYGAGEALNIRYLQVSGNESYCGCYTSEVGGRVSGMQLSPHALATTIEIYQGVDKYLYNTDFSGDYEPGGDQSLEAPTDVFFTLNESQLENDNEVILQENEFRSMVLDANVRSEESDDGSYQLQAGIYAFPSAEAEPVALLQNKIPDMEGKNNYILEMEGNTLSNAFYSFDPEELWVYSGQYYIGINVRKRSNGLTSPWSETYFCKIPSVQLDTPEAVITDTAQVNTIISWNTDYKADYYRLRIPGNDGNTYEMVISTRKDSSGTYNVDFLVNGFSNGTWAIKNEDVSELWIHVNDQEMVILSTSYDASSGSWQYSLELPYLDENRFMDYFELSALAGEDSRYVDSEVAYWPG